jgi:hypothetical protein
MLTRPLFAFALAQPFVMQSAVPPLALGGFTANEVRVQLFFTETLGEARLLATFTPSRADLHLYDTQLPTNGARGLGRPTRVKLVSSAVIQAAGHVVPDRLSTELIVAGTRVPVYAEGPVSISMPVNRRTASGGAAVLSITYMACTEKVCFPPVVDRRLSVVIPAEPSWVLSEKGRSAPPLLRGPSHTRQNTESSF